LGFRRSTDVLVASIAPRRPVTAGPQPATDGIDGEHERASRVLLPPRRYPALPVEEDEFKQMRELVLACLGGVVAGQAGFAGCADSVGVLAAGTSVQVSVEAVVHNDDLTARDRLAAILVLVLSQQVEDVVRLTWHDATVTDDLATITLGAAPIALPPPLDEPLRQLLAEPGHGRTAAHPHSPWIFRGHSPGRHLSAAHLRQRLKTVCSTRAARLGTLADLARTSPIPVLAEVLGYHQTTLERHAVAAAHTYGRYIASHR